MNIRALEQYIKYISVVESQTGISPNPPVNPHNGVILIRHNKSLYHCVYSNNTIDFISLMSSSKAIIYKPEEFPEDIDFEIIESQDSVCAYLVKVKSIITLQHPSIDLPNGSELLNGSELQTIASKSLYNIASTSIIKNYGNFPIMLECGIITGIMSLKWNGYNFNVLTIPGIRRFNESAKLYGFKEKDLRHTDTGGNLPVTPEDENFIYITNYLDWAYECSLISAPPLSEYISYIDDLIPKMLSGSLIDYGEIYKLSVPKRIDVWYK